MHTGLNPEELIRDVCIVRAQMGLGLGNSELADILKACAKKQVYIAKTEKGEPVAYLAYALISKYTLSILDKHRDHLLRLEELSEGHILLILDMAINPYHSQFALRLFKEALKRRRIICGVRNGQLVLMKKSKIRYKRVWLGLENREEDTPSDQIKYFKLIDKRSGGPEARAPL